MKAYSKRNKPIFSPLIAYISMAVFFSAGTQFILFFREIFRQSYATLNTFFHAYTMDITVLIPAITMRTFADENKPELLNF